MAIDLEQPLRLDVTAIPERWVPVAAAAMGVTRYLPDQTVERMLVVWDAESNEFVRLPVEMGAWYSGLEFQGLALEGRAVLLEGRRRRSKQRLGLLDVRTGQERWFDTDPATYGAGVRATVSPDGQTIATVLVAYHPDDPRGDTEEKSIAVVGLIDVASGDYRRLFASGGDGGWGKGSGTAWSPDQRLLATTYWISDDEHPDGDFVTVVLDLEGNVVMPSRLGSLRFDANCAWIDTHTLLLHDNDTGELAPLNVMTGQTGTRRSTRAPMTRVGDRMIYPAARSSAQSPVKFLTAVLDGSEERPWLVIDPPTVKVDRMELR